MSKATMISTTMVSNHHTENTKENTKENNMEAKATMMSRKLLVELLVNTRD